MPTTARPRPPFTSRTSTIEPRRRHSCRGWSLIELLVASLLFEVALLAIAPLFIRAARDVRSGGERAQAATLAQSLVEDGPREGPLYYSAASRRWSPEPPVAPTVALWVAVLALEVFPLAAIEDGRIEPSEANDGGGLDGENALLLYRSTVSISRGEGDEPVVVASRFAWGVE